MEKIALRIVLFLSLCLFVSTVFAADKEKSGEALFMENCSMCHPDGGNIMNKDFTLLKKDREEHGVKKAADIINKMRDPGPGMSRFDKSMISDKDAKKIADYILKTFK